MHSGEPKQMPSNIGEKIYIQVVNYNRLEIITTLRLKFVIVFEDPSNCIVQDYFIQTSQRREKTMFCHKLNVYQ